MDVKENIDWNKPIVSVRCTVYNHAKYLRQCLDGFIMQETTFPFEVIVHDDASTDNSASIIREYANKYPYIIKPILQTENQYSKHDGSINKHLRAATSPFAKYFAICEGDDYWIDPLKLQKQVDFLESHPDYGLVYTDVNFYFQNKEVMKRNYISSGKLKQSHDFEEHLINAGYIAPCTWVFRKDFLPKNSYQYVDGTFPMALDIWAQSKVYFLNETTAVYRHLSESASHSRSLQKGFYFTNGVFQIQKDYIKNILHSFLKLLKRRFI